MISYHHLNFNFSENFLSESDTKVHIQFPYPIHEPLRHTCVDPILKYHEDLVKEKAEFKALSKKLKMGQLEEPKSEDLARTYCMINQGLLEYYNHESSEVKCEVPYVSDFNQFYATGLLDSYRNGDRKYLIRPDIENNVVLTNIGEPNIMYLKPQITKTIHGLTVARNDLLLRHFDSVCLYKIDLNRATVVEKWNKGFKNEILDSKMKKNKVGVIVGDTLKMFDTKKGVEIPLKLSRSIKYIMFDFVDSNKIALMTQNDLSLYDLKTDECKVLIKPQLEPCDSLTTFKVHNKNVLNIATRHLFITTDLELESEKNYEFCTHMMKNSPCYIEINELGDFVCLSSQKLDEKVIFCGGNLPIPVPGINKTLLDCQLSNTDILLRADLAEKFNGSQSCGGIKLLYDSDTCESYLYSCNHLGEIFKQTITLHNLTKNNDQVAIQNLYTWIKNSYTDTVREQKPLHLTHAVDMSTARLVLEKKLDEERVLKKQKSTKKCSLFLNHYKNIYSTNKLGDLAANFAAIWDDEEEGEKQTEGVDLVPEVPAFEKVTSWIESSYFQ